MQAAGKEPCQGKPQLGKLKCADVVPKHVGYSQRSGGKIYKTGDYVAIGGKYTHCRNKITSTTQGADGRNPNATQHSGGRKRNGRRDRNNRSTGNRAAGRCGEGEYMIVNTDGGRENVWDSSDDTGALKKTSKIAGRCWEGVNKVRHL